MLGLQFFCFWILYFFLHCNNCNSYHCSFKACLPILPRPRLLETTAVVLASAPPCLLSKFTLLLFVYTGLSPFYEFPACHDLARGFPSQSSECADHRAIKLQEALRLKQNTRNTQTLMSFRAIFTRAYLPQKPDKAKVKSM